MYSAATDMYEARQRRVAAGFCGTASLLATAPRQHPSENYRIAAAIGRFRRSHAVLLPRDLDDFTRHLGHGSSDSVVEATTAVVFRWRRSHPHCLVKFALKSEFERFSPPRNRSNSRLDANSTRWGDANRRTHRWVNQYDAANGGTDIVGAVSATAPTGTL